MTTVASETFDRIKLLVQSGSVRISEHGYDELAADAIFARDVVEGVQGGKVVEDYPTFQKDPPCWHFSGTAMTLRFTRYGVSRKGIRNLQFLVTAYRPDPTRWENDFMRRRK